jgi:1-acyl-sn-glycerol-3-phosphate acyltransferase
MEQVESCIRRDLAVVFFPEGTSGRGDGILPFKPSLFEIAARRGEPVHFATLSYRSPPGYPPAHEAICWWGGMSFLPHFLGLLGMPSFEATLRFGVESFEHRERKALAERLRTAMQENFLPMD